MRTLILASLFFACSPWASAQTQVIFSKDGKLATVILMGMPSDPDPGSFFQALKIPAEDFQGKWSKKLSLAAADGSKSFDIACIFSKVIQNSGTCTLIFRSTEGVITVDRAAGNATLWLSGAAAALFADSFQLREDSHFIYRSNDGRLNVSVLRANGVVTDFVADWKGRGFF